MRNRRIDRALSGDIPQKILIASALLVAGGGHALASDPFYPPASNDPAVVMAAPSELEHRIERLEAHLHDLQNALRESQPNGADSQGGAHSGEIQKDTPYALRQIPAGSELVGTTQKRVFYRGKSDGRLYSAEHDGDTDWPFVIPGAESNGSAQQGETR